jgi:hydroxypyruvate reductase
MTDQRQFLEGLFRTAIASAQPATCLPPFLPAPGQLQPGGRLVVLGAGKASAAMARAVEDHWDGPLSGIVVTRYGYEVPCTRIEIVRAAHPVPDAAGFAAARRMLALAESLNDKDLVLALFSGGGSALLPLPLPGITLAEKQQINRDLLACGAAISEMNGLRRHLSAIKGGRLGAACFPARLITLLISDVPGDNPSDIASGPTVPDASTSAEALATVEKYKIAAPKSVLAALRSPPSESVKPGAPRLAGAQTHMIATPRRALEQAAALARQAGIQPLILGDALEGEARALGSSMGALALSVAAGTGPVTSPCVLLSGGETTVTVTGKGSGGRNVEFLLALGLTLKGNPRVHALAGDTDGVDGMEDIAGAYLSPDTLARAKAKGVDAVKSLAQNDGHGFFKALGDSIVTGPTFTNVNDFRAILIA